MCSLEFPDLDLAVFQKYRDRGVRVIGVNPDPKLAGGETAATLTLFAQQTRVSFPLGVDADKSYQHFSRGGAISPFPLDVVVDRQGKLAYVSREYDAAALTRVIDELLQK